jgi:hypothetical protein
VEERQAEWHREDRVPERGGEIRILGGRQTAVTFGVEDSPCKIELCG